MIQVFAAIAHIFIYIIPFKCHLPSTTHYHCVSSFLNVYFFFLHSLWWFHCVLILCYAHLTLLSCHLRQFLSLQSIHKSRNAVHNLVEFISFFSSCLCQEIFQFVNHKHEHIMCTIHVCWLLDDKKEKMDSIQVNLNGLSNHHKKLVKICNAMLNKSMVDPISDISSRIVSSLLLFSCDHSHPMFMTFK